MAAILGCAAVYAPSAAACSYPSNHCYGLARYLTGDALATGAIAFITTGQLIRTSNSGFATSELWVCDYYTYASCYTWVEMGQFVGSRVNADSPGTSRTWFWAEMPAQGSTCNTFAMHTSGAPAGDSERHAVKISYSGNFKWGFYMDSTFIVNSSACHDGRSNRVDVGTESTTDSAYVSGAADALQKRSTGGGWSYYWPGSILRQTDPRARAAWQTQDYSLSCGFN